jgi:hypothetical protein
MGSWLKTAIEFGIGVLEGYSQSRAERNSFVDLARHLSVMTGFEITNLRSNQATYRVPCGGQLYALIVTLNGQDFVLQALSLICFPSGHAPANVCRTLAQHNRQMPHCDYDLHDGDQGSLFFVIAKVRLGSLVPVFEEAAMDLVGKIAALDRALVECGYDR